MKLWIFMNLNVGALINLVKYIQGSPAVSKHIIWMSSEHLTVLWSKAEERAVSYATNSMCSQLEEIKCGLQVAMRQPQKITCQKTWAFCRCGNGSVTWQNKVKTHAHKNTSIWLIYCNNKTEKPTTVRAFWFQAHAVIFTIPWGKNHNASTISSVGIRPCRKIQVWTRLWTVLRCWCMAGESRVSPDCKIFLLQRPGGMFL